MTTLARSAKALAVSAAAAIANFMKTARIYAYLGYLYAQLCLLDVLERSAAAAASSTTSATTTTTAAPARRPKMKITRALVLFDYDEQAAFEHPDPVTHIDVTDMVLAAARTLPDDADPWDAVEDWQHLASAAAPIAFVPERRVRLEVRYTLDATHKFRRVLFHDQDHRRAAADSAEKARNNIIRAVLSGPPGLGDDLDVTTRMRRYLGPDLDWHGSMLLARDIFPMDKNETNALAFDCIRVVDGRATHLSIPYPDGLLAL